MDKVIVFYLGVLIYCIFKIKSLLIKIGIIMRCNMDVKPTIVVCITCILVIQQWLLDLDAIDGIMVKKI